jgi:hypothetical protein
MSMLKEIKKTFFFFYIILIISIEKKIIKEMMNLFSFSDRLKFSFFSYIVIVVALFSSPVHCVCVIFLFRFIHNRLSFRRHYHFQKKNLHFIIKLMQHTHIYIYLYIYINTILSLSIRCF